MGHHGKVNDVAKRLGVIVNPIAGMGGRVGLKGTDGPEVAAAARRLGASPEAPGRAVDALLRVKERLEESLEVVAAPGEMGTDEATEAGYSPSVVGSMASDATTADDTKQAARRMADMGVHLILFAGGDGTARDIYDAIEDAVPVLGVPAGVKMHSAAFATSPKAAADLALGFLTGQIDEFREAEVMDLDEAAFRSGALSAKLYGYLKVPHEPALVQGPKDGRSFRDEAAQEDIAAAFAETILDGWLYILGPGTTVRAIATKLRLDKTLLGVDLVLDGDLVDRDVTEARILEAMKGRDVKIVVTPIGGQGHILGRGNQQISPRVIRRAGHENIVVVATPEKLAGLRGRPLLVDTGDTEVDEMLEGYISVVTGHGREAVHRVAG